MITVAELAERIKSDIRDSVKSGLIPPTVADFAELHDYCDANCLGGADDLFGEMVSESDTDAEHQAKLDAFTAIHLPAIQIVDAWLKSE